MATENGAELRGERGDRVTLAYTRLRELIVLGRLAPGSRIIETTVATRLGVSRTPVRAALQRLQQEGYVMVANPGQQSRMSVAPLTQEDARELFGMVSVVEGLAASWAATRPQAERERVVAELSVLNRDLLDAATSERPDVHRVFELDERFHRRVVEAGAGPRLLALHDSFKPQSERYGRIYSSALIDEIGTSVQEHDEVVSAIGAGRWVREGPGSPDKAQRASSICLRMVRSSIRSRSGSVPVPGASGTRIVPGAFIVHSGATTSRSQ
jgi:DNA-binding GntR family transcriptional regulator